VSSDPPATAPVTAGRQGRRWRDVATVDLVPLRASRDFRLLFVGQGVSFAGSMITYVAIPYQVYALSRSSLLVGLLSLAELGPLLVTALVGGAIADAKDRRRIVQLTELGLAVVSAVLVANALLARPRLSVLFAAAACAAVLDGLQRPSLDALLPRVVTREQLPAAIALSSLRMTVGMVAGPPLGGLLVAVAGLPATYAVDVVSFAASLAALRLMRAAPPPPDAAAPSLTAVLDGWRYARSRPELLGTYLVDINAMLFGMPNALFPAVAAGFGGASVLGLLYAAPSVGSLVVTATCGWVGRVHHHGRAVVVAAGGWGVAIFGFGLARDLWLAVVLLALAGAADMVSGLSRSTIWNQTIPDALRGRLAGIEMLSYSTGPLLGNVEAGAVARAVGVRTSITSGGVLCVVGTAVLAGCLPAFWRYDARAHERAG
jgi:MFS family permease